MPSKTRPPPVPQAPRHGQTPQPHEDKKHHSRGCSPHPETAHTARSTSATPHAPQDRRSIFHESQEDLSSTHPPLHLSTRTSGTTLHSAETHSHENKGLSNQEIATIKKAYITAQDGKIKLMKTDLDFFRYFFGLGSSHALLADGINFCQEQIMKLDHLASRDSLIEPFVPRKVKSPSPTYQAILKKSNEIDHQLQLDLSNPHRSH